MLMKMSALIRFCFDIWQMWREMINGRFRAFRRRFAFGMSAEMILKILSAIESKKGYGFIIFALYQ